MTTDAVRKVGVSAKKRVFDQLDSMKSSRERRSRGVGNIADMEKRCSDIRLNWDVIAGSVVSERPKVVEPDSGSSSSPTAAPIPQGYNFKK
jgi:hypothetical protein